MPNHSKPRPLDNWVMAGAQPRRHQHAPDDRRVSLSANRIEASWHEIDRRVQAQCRRQLRHYPGIDPADCAQDVLVAMLKRGFARRFDPRLGSFEAFLRGVIRVVCLRAARLHYKQQRAAGMTSEAEVTREGLASLEWTELRDAIAQVRSMLAAGRLPAFDRVIAQAAERPLSGRRRRPRAEHGRDCRMRRHLRDKLRRYQ